MGEYYYLGLVEIRNSHLSSKALVKAEDGYYMKPGNIVAFQAGDQTVIADIISALFVLKGSDEEAFITSLAPVYEAEAIYDKRWEKKPEENKEEENTND